MTGDRRITCSCLGDRSTEYHERNGKGRRREARERSRFLFCVLCISIAFLIPICSSAADTNLCLPHCWKNQTSLNVQLKDGEFMEKIVTEKECKDWCISNETCIGLYWGFSPAKKLTGCWFQLSSSSKAAAESLTNATHWSLSDCTDDCLPYCWKEKWTHVQVVGGVLQTDMNTENECKFTCADDQGCNGADWNTTDNTCWLLFINPMEHIADPDPTHHWEIQRNLSTTCQQESKAAVPEDANAVLSTTKTAEAAETAENPAKAENAENPAKAENAENPAKAENAEKPVNAEHAENAANETLANETESSTEMKPTSDFDVIVFGTTTPGANGTRAPVAAGVVGKRRRPRPRGRGGAGVGRSHVSRNDVDCECPDYMIGIIVLGATMAFLVLIIICLVAFVIYQIREHEAEEERHPRRHQYKTSRSASSSATSVAHG